MPLSLQAICIFCSASSSVGERLFFQGHDKNVDTRNTKETKRIPSCRYKKKKPSYIFSIHFCLSLWEIFDLMRVSCQTSNGVFRVVKRFKSLNTRPSKWDRILILIWEKNREKSENEIFVWLLTCVSVGQIPSSCGLIDVPDQQWNCLVAPKRFFVFSPIMTLILFSKGCCSLFFFNLKNHEWCNRLENKNLF